MTNIGFNNYRLRNIEIFFAKFVIVAFPYLILDCEKYFNRVLLCFSSLQYFLTIAEFVIRLTKYPYSLEYDKKKMFTVLFDLESPIF